MLVWAPNVLDRSSGSVPSGASWFWQGVLFEGDLVVSIRWEGWAAVNRTGNEFLS